MSTSRRAHLTDYMHLLESYFLEKLTFHSNQLNYPRNIIHAPSHCGEQLEFPDFITLSFSKTLRGTDNYAEWVNAKFEDLLYGDNDSIKENVAY